MRLGRHRWLVAACVAATAPALVPAARAQEQPICAPVSLGISILPPDRLAGTLCAPQGASVVFVLIPGSTYSQAYWDFGYEPEVYNFRRAMNVGGYATLTIDRLGTGASSRPLSPLVTSNGEAVGVHKLVAALRSGALGDHAFAKVVVGGHSLGSGIAVLEAATYRDVDAVLLTGFSHDVSLTGAADVVATFYPAALDPRFVGRGYDPGYLTTLPGTRGGDFYAPGDSDPAVIAADEASKDVVAPGEFADGLLATALPYTDRIDAPVLIADGSKDKLACSPSAGNCASADALRAREAFHFTAAPSLSTYVLEGSGHDINLAANARSYQAAVLAWADSQLGGEP